MKKQTFVICDQETGYACSLMEYLNQRNNLPFDVQVFSSRESLLRFTKENETDLLLICAGMMCRELGEQKIGRIVLLSEGEVAREYAGFPAIYKYQPSEKLVEELMEDYAQMAVLHAALQIRKQMELIGVLSPLGRCGKTCFALTLGQILAEKRGVLYLNLEEYAGFESLMEREFSMDILDVMYFIRQKKENAIFGLHAALQKLGKLDFVPPAFSAGDLRDVRAEEWIRLLEDLASCGGYDTVILDLGMPGTQTMELLSMCSKIYMPLVPGVMAEAKKKHYEKELVELGEEEILEKIRYLNLPETEPRGKGAFYLEELPQGSMGTFVKMLLQEEQET